MSQCSVADHWESGRDGRIFVPRAQSGAHWPHTRDSTHSSLGQRSPALSGSVATSVPRGGSAFMFDHGASHSDFPPPAPTCQRGRLDLMAVCSWGDTSFLEAWAGLTFPRSPRPSKAAGSCIMVGAQIFLKLSQSSRYRSWRKSWRSQGFRPSRHPTDEGTETEVMRLVPSHTAAP